MDYTQLLNRIVDDGIAAVRVDYAERPPYLAGAVAGFEACRGKYPADLWRLLVRARRVARQAFAATNSKRFWRLRSFESEVEWVCNCVSAALDSAGYQVIIPFTARAVLNIGRILKTADQPAEQHGGAWLDDPFVTP